MSRGKKRKRDTIRRAVPQVRCPRCNRPQPDTGPDSIYWCGDCRCQFDGEPEEGGNYFSDPTKRAELADERRSRKQA